MPSLYIVPTKPDIMNAFATGRNPSHSAIAVTRGLLALNDDEIEAVVAHEISHIRNRDTLVSTIAAVLAGAVSYLAQIGYWSLFARSDSREQANVIGLFLIIFFAPIAAMIVRLAISRSREYGADYMGVVLTKKPKSLISALTKISDVAREHTLRGSSATSHMWIVNPFHKDWFTGLFSTHPPVKERIKRLEEITKLHI
jgi:heat shock protein HtpX